MLRSLVIVPEERVTTIKTKPRQTCCKLRIKKRKHRASATLTLSAPVRTTQVQTAPEASTNSSRVQPPLDEATDPGGRGEHRLGGRLPGYRRRPVGQRPAVRLGLSLHGGAAEYLASGDAQTVTSRVGGEQGADGRGGCKARRKTNTRHEMERSQHDTYGACLKPHVEKPRTYFVK